MLRGKIVKTYIFPASTNIKQSIGERFKTMCFKEDEWPELYEYLEELKPKQLL
jgi:hypothetical protein